MNCKWMIFGVFLVLGACKRLPENSGKTIVLSLEQKNNSGVRGTAKFVQMNEKVRMVVEVEGLKPGLHGIHIHEKSDCSAADASSAGGHWNPTFQNHGKWGSAAFHKGDIGNLEADAQGKAKMTLETDLWCIDCGDASKDILNKGLIVHQDADDLVSQPVGNAGKRVACAGIIK